MKFSELLIENQRRGFVIFLFFTCALVVWHSHYSGADYRNANATSTRAGIFHPTPEEQLNWRVNLNTATEAELVQLPRIGPALAQRILDYREEIGGFETVDELLEVKGIGPATYEKISGYCYVLNSLNKTENKEE